MQKKLLFGIAAIGVVIVAILVFLTLIGDPFGPKMLPQPNCGEDRYKFDASINSKEDFVNFVKNYKEKINDQYGNNWVKLDNFKDVKEGSPELDIRNAEVDWEKVLNAVQTESLLNRTIYVLKYSPVMCGEFTLKVSNDGYVSLKGCCGI